MPLMKAVPEVFFGGTYRVLSRPCWKQKQERKKRNVPLQQNVCPLIAVDWEAVFFTFARLDFSDMSATAALCAPGVSCLCH